MHEGGVIGRTAELAEGERFLDALAEVPTALVIRGEAGIGKSALWDEIVARARSRGLVVLACRPSEAETTLPLMGVGDLFDEVADAVLPDLPPPQRRALSVALLRTEPGPHPSDWRAIATAVRTVLATLSACAPVVLAIDDVQWLDRATARVLQAVVRRLTGLRVGALATMRAASTRQRLPLGLGRALPPERVVELDLGPLSLGSLYHLVQARLGQRLSRPALIHIERLSGGNPLFALEIARELICSGGLGSGAPDLALPTTLDGLIGARIRRQPTDTRRTLLVAAAASQPTVDLIEKAVGRARASSDLHRAERAGVLTVSAGAVAFTHPLLASTTYARASLDDRRWAHRRLASAVPESEERARHLALATTRRDERVAAALSEASERLARRGAPEDAAELSELAAERTPRRLEHARVTRLIHAADRHAIAGAHERSREILDELASELPPGPVRADVLIRRAATCHDDATAMTALCEQALAEAGEDDALIARAYKRLAASWHARGDNVAELRCARVGLRHAARTDDERLWLALVAAVGRAETWSLSVTPGLLEDGARREKLTTAYLAFEQSPSAALGIRAFYSGRMALGRRYLQQASTRASEAGDEVSRVAAFLQLAALEFFAGRWAEGVELADAGLDLEEQLGIERGGLHLYRALLAAGLGDVELARRHANASVERARIVGEGHVELLAHGALGFVELSLGNDEEAARILGEVLERDLATGTTRGSRYLDDGIESLVAVGDLERARVHAARFTETAVRSPMLVARAKAARSRGLIRAAEGDLDGALAELHLSLAEHAAAGQPFERARALLSMGVIHRRAKHRGAARESIEAALAIFEELPAPLFAERARSELARTGVRRRDASALTETEGLVARLAAQGLTNREIGQRAFLAPKSVEDVLRRVYRIVGVRNKTQLAARLAEHPELVGSPAS